MKRILQKIGMLGFVLILLLANTSPAFAKADSLVLTNVVYTPAGIGFDFSFDGTLSKAELKGTVKTASGDEYSLYCWKTDANSLRCTAPKLITGEEITVFLAGYIFYTKAPKAPLAPVYSCSQAGDASIEISFQWSDGTFSSATIYFKVTAGEHIDINFYIDQLISILELVHAPLTVSNWSFISLQCNVDKFG